MKNRSSYQKAYRQTHKAERKAWYEAHRQEQRAKDKAYYDAHREERKAYYQAYKEEIKVKGEAYRATHKAELNASKRQWNQMLKLKVFQHYSGEHPCCAYCDNDNLVVLTIDHIDNKGAEHRRRLGTGSRIYIWLKKHNYPKGFQVLCHNCNIQKYHDQKGGKTDE